MNHIHHLVTMLIPLTFISAQTSCSATPEREETNAPETSQRPIRGGTEASAYPEAVAIDMMQSGAVVGACSGVVIAPRAVLTAGHCVLGFDGFRVIAPYAQGQMANAVHTVTYDYVSSNKMVDPNHHDIGLIFLSSSIELPVYPIIASLPVPSGTKVLNLGRVKKGKASSTHLYVSKPLAVSPGTAVGFPFAYVAKEVIESGDSGGPDILPGPAPHTIVAVNSGAGHEIELLARVDLVSDWIHDQVGLHGNSCGDGTCTYGESCSSCASDCGSCATKTCAHTPCQEGVALSNTCDACVTQVCNVDSFCCEQQWDAQCIRFAGDLCGQKVCAASGDCNGVSYEGQCQDDVLVFCDAKLHTMDCEAIGLSCDWDPVQGFYSCL